MSAEIEAAEAIIRISGAGFTEVMKIVGPGSIWLTKNAVLATVYGLSKGGTARQITRDPNGMGITSVPTDRYDEIKSACKDYKIKFFSRKVDDTYTDICIKNSDLPSLNHILDNLGISAVKADQISVKSENEANTEKADQTKPRKTFEEEKEKLVTKKEDINKALNRSVERDFERKEPYFFADLENPTNYIKVKTDKAYNYAGKVYTVSNYHCYNNGVFVEELSDKPTYGKKRNWQKTKARILDITKIKNGNLVYFNSENELKEYQDIYNNQAKKTDVIEVNLNKENVETGEFKEALFKQLDEVLGKKGKYIEDVPVESPALKEEPRELKTGQKIINGNLKNNSGGIKDFANEYYKNNPYPPGLTPKDKEKLSDLREGLKHKNQEVIKKPVKMMRK